MCTLLGGFAVCSSPSPEFYSKCIHMVTWVHISIACILLAIAQAFAIFGQYWIWSWKTAKQRLRRICEGKKPIWTKGWWVGRNKTWGATGDSDFPRVWWGYHSYKSISFIAFHGSGLGEKVFHGDSVFSVCCSGEKSAFNNYIDVLWKCGWMGIVVVVCVCFKWEK